MKYIFRRFTNEEYFGDNISRPTFDIEDKNIGEKIGEFWHMSSEYVREIVEEMEKVRTGDSEMYDFGAMTVFVQVYKEGHEKFPGQAFIDYNWGDDSIEVDYDDIYNLMKDWRDYVDAWEKETGLIKK